MVHSQLFCQVKSFFLCPDYTGHFWPGLNCIPAPFTRTRGSIHPGSALTASFKKMLAFYGFLHKPGAAALRRGKKPARGSSVSFISWHHVASCLFDCLLFLWWFLLFKWPRVSYSKRLHEPGLSWPAFTSKNSTTSQPALTGPPYPREGLPS